MTDKQIADLIIDCVAVLIGDYDINRKYASTIILKMLLPKEMYKSIVEDDSVGVFDRNDSRVRTWTKQVVSKGKCEICGSKENLEAHHIIKWADYPKGRIDVNNGMCLCHFCHTEEHKCDPSYFMMKAKGGDSSG